MDKKTEKKVGLGNGCEWYKKCGGCQLQNLKYEDQLHLKMSREIKLLGKYAHVREIISMDEPNHYRCKVQAAFGKGRYGMVSGIYQSSTHRIVPVSHCMIEDEQADRIIVSVRKIAQDLKWKPFDNDSMSGFLRHVLVRKGFYTNEYMVVVVTADIRMPSKTAFIEELIKRHPEVKTIVQNVNRQFTSLVLGKEEQVLYGKGYIEDELLGCRFRISPKSFYQVNPKMTEILYKTAIDGLKLTGKERVIDAYCGTGTIGIIAAEKAKEVLGIELNPDAVADAKINAKMNQRENISFYVADSGEFLQNMARAGEHADAIIMDPPRAGCSFPFLSSVCTLAPNRIAYVSCNPDTLARDLAYLCRRGYKVNQIQPVDMFPHTEHVETVAHLSKVNTPKG